MNTKLSLENKLPTLIWAVLLIWWGMRWSLLEALPEGSGLLGTGVILLGVNALRKSARLPTNPNTTFLGLLTLLAGGVLVGYSFLHLPSQAPVLETVMITLGVMLLGCTILGSCKSSSSES